MNYLVHYHLPQRPSFIRTRSIQATSPEDAADALLSVLPEATITSVTQAS